MRPDLWEPTEQLQAGAPSKAPARVVRHDFQAVYDAYAEFVYRSLRRLGTPPAMLDDAFQEAFCVVHRRLGECQFESTLQIKSWVFRIAMRVSNDFRRSARRDRAGAYATTRANSDADQLETQRPGPLDRALLAEQLDLLHQLLDRIDESKRAVFVLSELEEMTMPEIADMLSINLNTAYSRLAAARRQFEAALKRHHAGGDRA